MRNLNVMTATRNELLSATAMNTLFDGGTLDLRDGTQPVNANTAATGVSRGLVSPLPTPAFAAPSAGAMAKSGTWEDASVAAGGTPTWFRLGNVGDTDRIDGSVGLVDDIKETSDATTTFTATTAVDTNMVTSLNEHAGRYVRMVVSGEENEIVNNDTAGAFNLRRAWVTTPSPNDLFVVVERYDLELTSVTTVTLDKLVIDTFAVNLDLMI